MSDLFQPGQHPDADQLNAFVDHALPPHERDQTLAHLATCAHCRQIVSLAMQPVEEVLPQPVPKRQPWLSGWNLLWPAAATTAALLGVIALTFHVRKAPQSVGAVHPPVLSGRLSESPITGAPERIKPAHAQPSKPAAKPQSTPPRPAEQPAPVLSTRAIVPTESINGLPIESRNVAPLAQASPQTSPIAGSLAGTNQTADQASAGVPVQSVVRSAAPTSQSQTLQAIRLAPLPSNLPIVSTATHAAQMLALDTQSTLFRSEDSGQHWTPVSAPWKGRAVRVGLTASTLRPNVTAAAPSRAPGALASTGTSSLSGTLTDATGADIPGATVTLLSPQPRTTRTDSQGHYAFTNLPPGTYTLRAESPGFTSSTHTIAVASNEPTIADQTLTIGSVSQTVEVSSANSAVNLIATPSEGTQVQSERKTQTRAKQPLASPVFELTTESGEHWVSPDGLAWKSR